MTQYCQWLVLYFQYKIIKDVRDWINKMAEKYESVGNTKESEALQEWALDLYKKSTAITIDSLRLFITLDSSLLSAYLVFYNQIQIAVQLYKLVPVLTLLLSLLFALLGIYPRSYQVDIGDPEAIGAARNLDLERKKRNLLLSIIFLFLTFIWVAIIILLTSS